MTLRHPIPIRFAPPEAGRCRLALLLATVALTLGAACAPAPVAFDEAVWQQAETAHRAEVEARLVSDRSWLTVAGLHFLTPGEHTVGSAEDADLEIADRFAELAVTVMFRPDGTASARVADGVSATVGGEPFTEGELTIGEDHAVVLDDRVWFWLHTSGARRALRLRDLDYPLRANFTGRKWFDLDPRFRVEATFEPYPERIPIQAVNIRGDLEDYVSDGEAVFDWEGQEIRMQAFTRSNGNLFFVMADGTSGSETYPAARFLTAPPPDEGRVILDFNRAESPPCGFSPFTTCPTPPAQNRLPFRVEAGERYYHETIIPTGD